jgi:hypothetical protein
MHDGRCRLRFEVVDELLRERPIKMPMLNAECRKNQDPNPEA